MLINKIISLLAVPRLTHRQTARQKNTTLTGSKRHQFVTPKRGENRGLYEVGTTQFLCADRNWIHFLCIRAGVSLAQGSLNFSSLPSNNNLNVQISNNWHSLPFPPQKTLSTPVKHTKTLRWPRNSDEKTRFRPKEMQQKHKLTLKINGVHFRLWKRKSTDFARKKRQQWNEGEICQPWVAVEIASI